MVLSSTHENSPQAHPPIAPVIIPGNPSLSSVGEISKEYPFGKKAMKDAMSDTRTKIHVLWLAGTMGSLPGEDGRIEPRLTGPEFGEKFFSVFPKFRSEFDLHWHLPDGMPDKGIDSTEHDDQTIRSIQEKTYELLCQDDGFASIIICHGTDTMAPTARRTGFALQNLPKSVIFTGTQIDTSDPSTDAYNNFGFSLEMSRTEVCEVIAVFEDSAYRGVAFTKRKATSKDPFVSPHQPILGWKVGKSDEIRLNANQYHNKRPDKFAPPLFYPDALGAVKVITMDPSLNDIGRMRDELRGRHDAVVIEGYAGGNMPKKLNPLLAKHHQKHPVIIVPGADTEGEIEPPYQVSAKFSHKDLIFASRTDKSTAHDKARWLLAQAHRLGLAQEDINPWLVSRFNVNIAGEIVHPENDAPEKFPRQLQQSFCWEMSEHLEEGDDPQTTFYSLLKKRKKAWLMEHAKGLQVPEEEMEEWISFRLGILQSHMHIKDNNIFFTPEDIERFEHYWVLRNPTDTTLDIHAQTKLSILQEEEQIKDDSDE